MIDLEAIDDLLLGDASIHPHGDIFSFAQAGEVKADFVLMVKDILEASGFEPRLDQVVRQSDGTFVSTTWTLSSQFWAEQRRKFYPDGMKIIPADAKVSPRSLLMLYLCDGSLGWAHGKPWTVGSSPWIELALCSYTLEDVESYGDKLVSAVGVSGFSVKGRYKYPRLCVYSRDNLSLVFQFMLAGGVIPPSQEYKFRGFI